jgi:hypothetical protein
MKTTIHTPATTNVRPVTYGRNPQLRTPDARRTRFLHFNLIGPPALHSFSVTGDQLIAVIADAIATSGKPVAEYWLSFAELRALVDAAITTTGGWSSPFLTGAASLDALESDVANAIRERARAILLAHVPLLLESTVPAPVETETVGADVATIGTADLDTGAVDPVTDELTDTADAGAFPHDVAAGAGLDTLLDDVRTKQQLADALRAVPGRDELPELSDRSLKRANRVQLAALAELFDV